jgi:hypothetical protein
MKLTRTLTLTIVASIGPFAAATLPLDRPTPPPCCADGICSAHAHTFGYFQTRWRVWPGLSQAPMPTVKQPTVRQIPGLPAMEPPKAEEEDRQAPPPIRTVAPPRPTTEAPPAGSPPPATPQTLPFNSPSASGGTSQPTMPFGTRPTSPSGTTPTPPQQALPFGNEPSRVPETPLELPFSPSASQFRRDIPPASSSYRTSGTVRPANPSPANPSPANESSATSQQRNSNDPPPPPPFRLGRAGF